MDKIVVTAVVKKADRRHLSKIGINTLIYNHDTRQNEPKEGYAGKRWRYEDTKNGCVNRVEVYGTLSKVRIECNPNRYYASNGNDYQITTQKEFNDFMKYINRFIKNDLKVAVDKNSFSYNVLHYNIDVKLKEHSKYYSKVMWALNSVVEDRNKVNYLSPTYQNSDVMEMTGCSFNIQKKLGDIDYQISSTNYDKAREQSRKRIVYESKKRFEMKFDTIDSIKFTFGSNIMSSEKLKVKAIKKKVGSMYNDHMFKKIPQYIEDNKQFIKECMYEAKVKERYWCTYFTMLISNKLFDVGLIRQVFVNEKINNIEDKMCIITELLKILEEEKYQEIKTIYHGNIDRMNELYKKITGNKCNII